MKKVIQFIDRISRISAGLVSAAIVVSLVLTVVEVCARSLFNTTTYIANEYTGYCMALISFLGFSYGLKQNSHVRINMIDKLFRNSRWIYIYYCILDGIGLVVSAYMTYYVMAQWVNVFQFQTRSIQTSETLIAIPQIVLPIGAALLCLQFIGEGLKNILRFRGESDIHMEESKEFI